jgi:hypothetical protein
MGVIIGLLGIPQQVSERWKGHPNRNDGKERKQKAFQNLSFHFAMIIIKSEARCQHQASRFIGSTPNLRAEICGGQIWAASPLRRRFYPQFCFIGGSPLRRSKAFFA